MTRASVFLFALFAVVAGALLIVFPISPSEEQTPAGSLGRPKLAVRSGKTPAPAAVDDESDPKAPRAAGRTRRASEGTPDPRSSAAPTAEPTATPSRAATSESADEDGEYPPEVDAWREVARRQAEADRPRGGPPPEAPVPIDTLAAAPSPAPSPDTSLLPLVGGQARGFTMLYLMHPRARPAVERQVETMLRANVKDLYLGVLVDGTFSIDFEYLSAIVRRLNTPPHTLTLVLYLTNGPTMRRREDVSYGGSFNGFEPVQFRGAIRFDPETRDEFQRIAARAKAVFDLNRQLNSENLNVAIPMLEDNLDRDAYGAMRELARGALSPDVRIVRNPCPGCFEGNDTDTLGDPIETHDIAVIGGMPRGSGFSFDGEGYRFTGEPVKRKTIAYDRMASLLDQLVAEEYYYVGLWRAERQGIYSDELLHPDQRVYEVPTQEMMDAEVQLLRSALSEIATEEEP